MARRKPSRKAWDPRKKKEPWDPWEEEQFVDAYIEAALWSTMDPDTGGEPLDANYTPADISAPTFNAMVTDSRAFMRDNWTDIKDALERAGHDFWLTRNHHGAGFWDGDWPEGIGQRLTTSAEGFGEVYLYISGGRIYGESM